MCFLPPITTSAREDLQPKCALQYVNPLNLPDRYPLPDLTQPQLIMALATIVLSGLATPVTQSENDVPANSTDTETAKVGYRLDCTPYSELQCLFWYGNNCRFGFPTYDEYDSHL